MLLEEKTKKGGWKARHVDSGCIGHIVNSEKVPGDKQPGDVVELLVHSPEKPSFLWPTVEEEQRAQKGQDKTKKGPGSQPRGGRR